MGTVEVPARNFKKRALIVKGYTYPQYSPDFGIIPCTATKHQVGWHDGGFVPETCEIEATDSTDVCDGEYQLRVKTLDSTVKQMQISGIEKATPDVDINIDTSPDFIPEWVGSTIKIQSITTWIDPPPGPPPLPPPTPEVAKTFWYNMVGNYGDEYVGDSGTGGTGMGFIIGNNGTSYNNAKPPIITSPPDTLTTEWKVKYYQSKVGHIPNNITLPLYTPRLFSITGSGGGPGGNTDIHEITGIVKEYKGDYTPNGVHSFAVTSDGLNPQYFVIADDTVWISYGTNYITDFDLDGPKEEPLWNGFTMQEAQTYMGNWSGINQPIPWFGGITIKRAAGWGWTERFGREMNPASVVVTHSAASPMVSPIIIWEDSYDWDGVWRMANTIMSVIIPFETIGQKEYRVRIDVKDKVIQCHQLGWVLIPPNPPTTMIGTWVWGELP